MKISTRIEEFAVLLEGEQLSQVTHFIYLESLMTHDRPCKNDVRSGISQAKNAFLNKKKYSTKSFSLNLKKGIVKTVIWSTLLYGAESLTLRRDGIQRLESCEVWLWRRILSIFWSERVSNDEVLWRVDVEKSV